MGPLTRLGIALADYTDRRNGHPFLPSSTAAIRRAAADTPDRGTSMSRSGQPGRPTGTPLPVGAGPRVIPPVPAVIRPGAGHHANGCIYIDDVDHRCVNESGQPSNQTCVASWYRNNRLPKGAA